MSPVDLMVPKSKIFFWNTFINKQWLTSLLFLLHSHLWISCVGDIFVLVLSSKSNIHNEFPVFVLFRAILEGFYLSNSLKKFLCLVSTLFGKLQHFWQKELTPLTLAGLLGAWGRRESQYFIDHDEPNGFISAVVIFHHLLLETLLWGAKHDILYCSSSPSPSAPHPPLGTGLCLH